MALNETARCHVLAVVDLVLDTPARSVGAAVEDAMMVAAPLLSLPQRALRSRSATSQVLAAFPEGAMSHMIESCHVPYE